MNRVEVVGMTGRAATVRSRNSNNPAQFVVMASASDVAAKLTGTSPSTGREPGSHGLRRHAGGDDRSGRWACTAGHLRTVRSVQIGMDMQGSGGRVWGRGLVEGVAPRVLRSHVRRRCDEYGAEPDVTWRA